MIQHLPAFIGHDEQPVILFRYGRAESFLDLSVVDKFPLQVAARISIARGAVLEALGDGAPPHPAVRRDEHGILAVVGQAAVAIAFLEGHSMTIVFQQAVAKPFPVFDALEIVPVDQAKIAPIPATAYDINHLQSPYDDVDRDRHAHSDTILGDDPPPVKDGLTFSGGANRILTSSEYVSIRDQNRRGLEIS
jgi:hypothetical protein